MRLLLVADGVLESRIIACTIADKRARLDIQQRRPERELLAEPLRVLPRVMQRIAATRRHMPRLVRPAMRHDPRPLADMLAADREAVEPLHHPIMRMTAQH